MLPSNRQEHAGKVQTGGCKSQQMQECFEILRAKHKHLKTHPIYWRSNLIGSWKSSWIVAHWCCLPRASLIWMSICLETCRSALAFHLSKPTPANIHKSGVRASDFADAAGNRLLLVGRNSLQSFQLKPIELMVATRPSKIAERNVCLFAERATPPGLDLSPTSSHQLHRAKFLLMFTEYLQV